MEDASANKNSIIEEKTDFTDDRFGFKSALQFDSTDNFEVVSHSSLNPSKELSIALWLKIDTLTNRFTPILHRGGTLESGFTNREYILYVENDSNLFFESIGNASRTYPKVAIPLKEWFFFSCVIDRNNHQAKFYLNGELVKESIDNSDSFYSNNSNLTIGTWVEENSQYATNFNGAMDDIRIYNRALNDDEIEKLYTKGACYQIIYDTITYVDTITYTDTVFIYDTITYTDTVFIYDTIAVTDTLVIDIATNNLNKTELSCIKFYPNPTKDILNIKIESGSTINNYRIKIISMNQQTVFDEDINQPEYQINLANFGSTGLYFIQILDDSDKVIDTKKLVLE